MDRKDVSHRTPDMDDIFSMELQSLETQGLESYAGTGSAGCRMPDLNEIFEPDGDDGGCRVPMNTGIDNDRGMNNCNLMVNATF